MLDRETLVERDVMIQMRDGMRLAADIYRPSTDEKLPLILERTPYGKTGVSRAELSLADPNPRTRVEVAMRFAERGFAVMMQDCRGRFGSEGTFSKYVNEAEDGADTLAWIIEQPWSDGRVGTMGLSYGAHTQLALASLAPPGLACMFMDSGGFSNAYKGGIRRGGAFELKQVTWAYKHALLSPETAADPAREAALRAVDLAGWFRSMPWRPGRSPLAAAPEYEAYVFEQWRESRFTKYWKRQGLYAEGFYDAMPDIPVAIVGSWYDPYVLTCTQNFRELARRNSAPVTLTMGPWTHGDRSREFAGDVAFGPSAPLDGNIAEDYFAMRLAWFDRWLRGIGDTPRTNVRYFEMGGGEGGKNASGQLRHGGRWKRTAHWPPATETLELYLQAGGELSRDPPEAASSYEYRFDPADPVPTIGGALTSGEPLMRGGAYDQRVGAHVFTVRADAPNGPLSDRPDVLVFETEPLARDIVVTGEIEVDLYVSSDCPDTDFTVKVIDAYPRDPDFPDGFAMNVTDAIFRMRFRNGWEQEAQMHAGEVYAIRLTPFATSNRFAKGHRLRIDISSSNYPLFDLNANTGGGPEDQPRVAHNRVYCGGAFPSRVRLPVMFD
jgi:putative CocE/NonD family hydrolase